MLPTGHGHTLPPLFLFDRAYWRPAPHAPPSARKGSPIPSTGGQEAAVGAFGRGGGRGGKPVAARGMVSVRQLRREFMTTQVCVHACVCACV